MSGASTATYARGALYGLAAALIWSGMIVAVRFGLRTSLTAWDITALRFGVGGVLLLPTLLREGLALDRLGWGGVAALVIGCGAPMVLIVNTGLLFAPVAHAGALFPGMVPMFVALMAIPILRERFTPAKKIGMALMLGGVIAIVVNAGGLAGSRQSIGHALFLTGAILWACYTIAMRRFRLDGMHAAAIAAVGSLVLYLPVYAVVAGASLFHAALADIALQAFVQGFLTAVVSLVLYGRAVGILGALGGATFPALVPAMVAMLGIPVLGEWPGWIDWAAIIVTSIGVYVVSGGPLPNRPIPR